METQTNPPETVKKSIPRRFFAWLTCWQTIRQALFALLIGITLIAAGYTYSNVTGKRGWEKCKESLQMQGEVLDTKAYIPAPIPAERNFAATPCLVTLGEKWHKPEEVKKVFPDVYDKAYEAMSKQSESNSVVPPVDRALMDLPAWAAGFQKVLAGRAEPVLAQVNKDRAARAQAAAAVLENLRVYDPIFKELREANAVRPEGLFAIDYQTPNPLAIVLRHLPVSKKLTAVLRLRASSQLAAGSPDEAYQDLQLMLRLAETVRNEPVLISSLVDVAMLRFASDVVWEGLATGAWTTPQLESMQAQLGRVDVLANLQKVLRAERAFMLRFMDYLRVRPDKHRILQEVGGEPGDYSELAKMYSLVPRGWLYKEQQNYAEIFQEMFLTGQGYDSRRIYPEKARAVEQKYEAVLRNRWHAIWKHHILTGLLVPAIQKVPWKAAEMQTVLDEATLACALERYRRAKGEFPEHLEALVPQFITNLPQDVITGKPLVYKRMDDGQFQLYGVAWDGQDNGGLVPRQKYSNGDWVWRYPAKGETTAGPTR